MIVGIETCTEYSFGSLLKIFQRWEPLFAANVRKGDRVVIKPNWLSDSHEYYKTEWSSVITHPDLITAVLALVLEHLAGQGSVTIGDAPQTDSSWDKIMARMEPERWVRMGKKAGIDIQIIDLRDHEWRLREGIVVDRKRLQGDPKGSTECDLNSYSEFANHKPSKRGYYGADYNIDETNQAHCKQHHKYKVSRSVIESDVFINLPKMKTHKKVGITCSLKNLVGINTYKNWLPHFTLGTPDEGGDQFNTASVKNKSESLFSENIKQYLSQNVQQAKWFIPAMKLSKALFGDTRDTIRSGNWYGNDTVWRMILDLNKILLYANPDGTMRADSPDSRKRYISIVDGIIGGEGNGPDAPDSIEANLIIGGSNPVAVDAVCARMMGFDWRKIPLLRNSFLVKHYSFCDFAYDDINLSSSDQRYNGKLSDLPSSFGLNFMPHFGWKDHIEL